MGKIVHLRAGTSERASRSGAAVSGGVRGSKHGRVKVLPGSRERDARYKQRAQVLLYQAASLLAEVEGSEQRLAWLLEDCADLLVREEQLGPVA